jgi:DNA ligase (NAD+)
MNREDAKRRIAELAAEINRHDRLYYVEARPVIGDRDYDLLEIELRALEKEFPDLVSPDSPTQRVAGAPVAGFAQVRHDPPMQSLDKTHSKGELADFDAFVRRETDGFTYVVEPKVDGVSMSLRYEGRRLVRAATRGNGTVGDDVTANVKTIRSVPLTLPAEAPDEIEVRGEVYMTRDGFAKLNEREEEAGREPFANPRNAAAGSLKQLDPKEAASRPLDIVVYNGGGTGCDGFATHTDMIAAFKSWGLPVAPWSRKCATIEEVFAAIDELEGLRHSFRFEIDGAVLKLDERTLYAKLGATAHGPRWARAYKYAPERVETVVESITVQVGRTGVLTPVAELRPVELAGSVISRATLHNADQIARQDIRIGDHVWLVKAGDVIPAIESPMPEKRDGSEKTFSMPERCPVCGGETRREEGEVAIRCANPVCPAKLVRRLEHFAARNALDIRAVGGKVAEVLVAKGLVKDPLDLFSLDGRALAELDVGEEGAPRKFGRNAKSVIDALAAARELPLDKWLFAVGIPNVGVTVAKDIAAEHEKLSDLADSPVLKAVVENDAKKGRDRKILQIKAEAARAVLAFFAGDYGKAFLKRMAGLGIDPRRAAPEQTAKEGPLAGAGCVLTGTLSMPRPEYAKLIERVGGIVQSAVTSKTRYLIAGENTGATKTAKARELGTEVIDEATLRAMLGLDGADATSASLPPDAAKRVTPRAETAPEQPTLF